MKSGPNDFKGISTEGKGGGTKEERKTKTEAERMYARKDLMETVLDGVVEEGGCGSG